MQVEYEATVYVVELDIKIKASLLKGSPNLLSLGKICDDHGFDYIKRHQDTPYLQKKGGNS